MDIQICFSLCCYPTVRPLVSYIRHCGLVFSRRTAGLERESSWKGNRALYILVWLLKFFPAFPVAYLSFLCTWSLLSLHLFLESIVVQYTQSGLNGSKIFLIKDGLVTGTPQDSPLGNAFMDQIVPKFPLCSSPYLFLR